VKEVGIIVGMPYFFPFGSPDDLINYPHVPTFCLPLLPQFLVPIRRTTSRRCSSGLRAGPMSRSVSVSIIVGVMHGGYGA
jgi:hypothetical protein